MELNELQTREQTLRERQMELQAVMSASDAHCLKCYKLGIDFKETYPEDYEAYVSARDEYNAIEGELMSVMGRIGRMAEEASMEQREEGERYD